jgi:hypothetical protein
LAAGLTTGLTAALTTRFTTGLLDRFAMRFTGRERRPALRVVLVARILPLSPTRVPSPAGNCDCFLPTRSNFYLPLACRLRARRAGKFVTCGAGRSCDPCACCCGSSCPTSGKPME